MIDTQGEMASKATKIIEEINAYQKDMSFENTRIEKMKEVIKEYYQEEKRAAIEENRDFDRVKIDDIFLQEVKKPTYSWLPTFRETLVDLGIAHLVLKNGNQLNKRFDLTEFELPINPENKSLHFYNRKTEEQKSNEKTLLSKEEEKWELDTNEDLVKRYIRYKKKYDLKKDRYNNDKKRLLDAMLQEGIDKMEGFSVKDETPGYNFSAMYHRELEEQLVLATNGEIFVDLIGDKNEVIEIKKEELYDVEEINKRFGQKKKDELREILGDAYYYIQAKRLEENILDRFPIATGAVDELIDEGYLDKKTLEKERYIARDEDYNMVFEIVTQDSIQKRHDVYMAKEMPRRLARSGYYDSVTQ